jgi:hypothetical protein
MLHPSGYFDKIRGTRTSVCAAIAKRRCVLCDPGTLPVKCGRTSHFDFLLSSTRSGHSNAHSKKRTYSITRRSSFSVRTANATSTIATLLIDNRSLSKLAQGITTEITGEGGSIAPQNALTLASLQPQLDHYKLKVDWTTLDGYFKRLEKSGTPLTLARMLGWAKYGKRCSEM